MSEPDFNAYLAWRQLPAWIRLEAVRILRQEDDLMELVSRLRQEHGADWFAADVLSHAQRKQAEAKYGFYVPSVFHMTVGVNVRNLLRRRGLPDKKLPFVQACRDYYGVDMECGNWDDYYVQACEEASEQWRYAAPPSASEQWRYAAPPQPKEKPDPDLSYLPWWRRFWQR